MPQASVETHQDTEFGTEYMISGPRDDHELSIVVALIEASLSFAPSDVG